MTKLEIITITVKKYLEESYGEIGEIRWLTIKKSYYIARIKIGKWPVVVLVSPGSIEVYDFDRKLEFFSTKSDSKSLRP